MRKLALTDIDGTVLRHGTEDASQPVAHAANTFVATGNELIPVTSRTAKMMGQLALQLGLRGLGVLDGGATVFDFGKNQRDEALSRWMSPELTLTVLQTLGTFCTEIYYGADSHVYSPDTPIQLTDDSPSIFAVYHNTQTQSLKQALGGIADIDTHYNTYENDQNRSCVQIVRQGVSKRSAVEKLLADPRFSDIPPERIMALGDGKPDVDLFAAVPDGAYQVALANAHPDLLAESTHIFPHVDEDGFAAAINMFMAA